jgi:hypothetical protein
VAGLVRPDHRLLVDHRNPRGRAAAEELTCRRQTDDAGADDYEVIRWH